MLNDNIIKYYINDWLELDILGYILGFGCDLS